MKALSQARSRFSRLAPASVLCPVRAAVALAILLTFSTPAAAVPGDVDGDGYVNTTDTLLIAGHVVGRSILTSGSLSRADANADSFVDVADARWSINNSHSSGTLTIYLPGNVPLVLVRIPAGSFLMGRYAGERSSFDWEDPQHTVNIGYDFWMGRTEVTQAQWVAVMGSNPSSGYGVGDNYPVYYVSWNDIAGSGGFIDTLNAHLASTGQGVTVRLPSESEWEYSCRAGTQTRFFFGDSLDCGDYCEDCAAGGLPGLRSDYMWYCGNYTGTSHEVGTKLPNQFGLYDMSGNLWEWCEDWWHDDYNGAPTDGSAWVVPSASYRVIRGGRWTYGAGGCRSAPRYYGTPGYRNNPFGFRLAAGQ